MKDTNGDAGALSNPPSFLRSGFFYWLTAGLYARGELGLYWSLRSGNTTGSYSSYFYGTGLNLQYNDTRGNGFAVRCDKSFTNLINTSYSMKTQGQTTEDNRDSGILSNPISFLRSGYLYWLSAALYNRGSGGYCWSLRSAGTTDSSYLSFYNKNLYPQDNSYRGFGFAVQNAIMK